MTDKKEAVKSGSEENGKDFPPLVLRSLLSYFGFGVYLLLEFNSYLCSPIFVPITVKSLSRTVTSLQTAELSSSLGPRAVANLDLTRLGGHPRVWRRSLREGSPHAHKDRV